MGHLLQTLRLEEAAYYIMAVVPQYAINPYYSHYNPDRFCGGWWPMWLHWILVLMIYGFITKRMSVKVAIPLFFAMAIITLILAHITLQVCGYEFELDSI